MKDEKQTENNRQTGNRKEDVACWFLIKNGYRIRCRNYRCRQGEVDIIAQKEDYIVFVEVKYRKTNNCGYPSAAVNRLKQQKISAVAKYYLYAEGFDEEQAIRFDVVEILGNKIRIIENAFNYREWKQRR